MIDHLLYATPDLHASVEDLNRRFDVRLTLGGRHANLGTRNFLADLGDRAYLEVIGPDPDLPVPVEGRPLGIDFLTQPRLATWAARVTDVDKSVRTAGERGCHYDPVLAMSRDREDGVHLAWRIAVPSDGQGFDGVMPLLIQWETEAYAAELSTKGIRLESFSATHPDAEAVRQHLAALGLANLVTVRHGEECELRATLSTPAGEVLLGE
jgi:Glyoxalase-like domain